MSPALKFNLKPWQASCLGSVSRLILLPSTIPTSVYTTTPPTTALTKLATPPLSSPAKSSATAQFSWYFIVTNETPPPNPSHLAPQSPSYAMGRPTHQLSKISPSSQSLAPPHWPTYPISCDSTTAQPSNGNMRSSANQCTSPPPLLHNTPR